jgi:hypothetical protein
MSPPAPVRDRRSRLVTGILGALCVLGPGGCEPEDPARELVRESIRVHGGERFERIELEFDFRDRRFLVRRDDGRFRYERHYTAEDGASVVEWMDNDGTGRMVDGAETVLDEAERARVETAVNSVVYFGFLPFRLLDPAVRLRELETAEVEGRPYRRIEVTFDPAGGGVDWEDRFVYWFHRDDHTLDYLAYRYHRDGGGTRFRRAVNRREVGGLLLQDYENYTADSMIDDIARYHRFFEEDRLRLLSMVELENVSATFP